MLEREALEEAEDVKLLPPKISFPSGSEQGSEVLYMLLRWIQRRLREFRDEIT